MHVLRFFPDTLSYGPNCAFKLASLRKDLACANMSICPEKRAILKYAFLFVALVATPLSIDMKNPLLFTTKSIVRLTIFPLLMTITVVVMRIMFQGAINVEALYTAIEKNPEKINNYINQKHPKMAVLREKGGLIDSSEKATLFQFEKFYGGNPFFKATVVNYTDIPVIPIAWSEPHREGYKTLQENNILIECYGKRTSETVIYYMNNRTDFICAETYESYKDDLNNFANFVNYEKIISKYKKECFIKIEPEGGKDLKTETTFSKNWKRVDQKEWDLAIEQRDINEKMDILRGWQLTNSDGKNGSITSRLNELKKFL